MSDESWKTMAGPILYSDLLKGESFDARLEPKGWSLPGFDDVAWESPRVRLQIEDGQEGQLVTVSCAEMLNEDNTLYTINLREAVQQETYRNINQSIRLQRRFRKLYIHFPVDGYSG